MPDPSRREGGDEIRIEKEKKEKLQHARFPMAQVYSRNAMTKAKAPPRPRLERTALGLAALELVVFALALVVVDAVPSVVPVAVVSVPASAVLVVVEPEPEPLVVEVLELELEAAPPEAPETALPGRLTVESLARAWKFARERVAFAAVLGEC
jgi:hypothetical protein